MFDLPDFSGPDAIPPGDPVKVSFPPRPATKFREKIH
jgi:hypothetical protein